MFDSVFQERGAFVTLVPVWFTSQWCSVWWWLNLEEWRLENAVGCCLQLWRTHPVALWRCSWRTMHFTHTPARLHKRLLPAQSEQLERLILFLFFHISDSRYQAAFISIRLDTICDQLFRLVLSSLCLVLFLFSDSWKQRRRAHCGSSQSVTLPLNVRVPPLPPQRGSLSLMPLCCSAAHVRGSLSRCNVVFYVVFLWGGWPFCVVEVQPSKQPWPQWRWHSSLPSDRLPALAVQTHACLQRNQTEKQEVFLSHDPYTRIRDISPLGSECVFYEMANMNPPEQIMRLSNCFFLNFWALMSCHQEEEGSQSFLLSSNWSFFKLSTERRWKVFCQRENYLQPAALTFQNW